MFVQSKHWGDRVKAKSEFRMGVEASTGESEESPAKASNRAQVSPFRSLVRPVYNSPNKTNGILIRQRACAKIRLCRQKIQNSALLSQPIPILKTGYPILSTP